MSGVHARLSASAAHRWLNCAASVAPGGAATIYAATGTFAHDISAQCLADDTVSPSDFFLQKKTVDGHEVECDMEMVDAVRLYVDEVNADHKDGDEGWIEMPLLGALQKIDPDLGGTADYVRYREADRTLRVFDFKYGQGVFVDAEDNEQLKIYALGAMLECGKPADKVTVTVVQPRFEGAKPVRDYEFPAIELLDFAADLVEAAEKTRLASPPYAAGDWCKFCPKAGACPELERKHHALVAAEFADAPAIAPEKLGLALQSIPALKERIKAIEEAAYTLAMQGTTVPGFKLVEKRANRKWKSEGEVVMWAQERAIDPWEKSLISPAAMEKILAKDAPRGKKKEAGAALEPLVERVSSGYALVPDTDERPPAKLVTANDFPSLL